jgi:hypothetical protein
MIAVDWFWNCAVTFLACHPSHTRECACGVRTIRISMLEAVSMILGTSLRIRNATGNPSTTIVAISRPN